MGGYDRPFWYDMRFDVEEAVKVLNSNLNLVCKYVCTHEHDFKCTDILIGKYEACKTCRSKMANDMAVDSLTGH